MKCPRCQAVIASSPDAGGLVVCASCGARLRAKAVVPSGTGASAPAPATASAPAAVAEPKAVSAGAGSPLRLARAATDPRAHDTARFKLPGARSGSSRSDPVEAPAGATLDTVLDELKAIRATQEEILSAVRGRSPAFDGFSSFEAPEPPTFDFGDERSPAGSSAASRATPVVRARRRKTVLLVDDDENTRKATLEALGRAEVPVRSVSGGNEALAAIAQEKPDVIVMELEVGGPMAGKDVINMIKATMEWVDIPIVLYTRMPIENQREARTVHGADELILKSAGPDELVARVITVFRKG